MPNNQHNPELTQSRSTWCNTTKTVPKRTCTLNSDVVSMKSKIIRCRGHTACNLIISSNRNGNVSALQDSRRTLCSLNDINILRLVAVTITVLAKHHAAVCSGVAEHNSHVR